jgi:hypothetical protein
MSLINDALQRASQSEKNRPRVSSPPGAIPPAPPPRRSLLPALTGAAVIVLLAAAGWLIHFSFAACHRTASAPSVAADKPAVPALPPGAEAPPAPVPATGSAPAVLSAPPAASNPPVAPLTPAPAAAVLPPFPDLKLQGILYSHKNPKIIINGETRGENEPIGDVFIVRIFPAKVTVQWDGQTKDLYLESP